MRTSQEAIESLFFWEEIQPEIVVCRTPRRLRNLVKTTFMSYLRGLQGVKSFRQAPFVVAAASDQDVHTFLKDVRVFRRVLLHEVIESPLPDEDLGRLLIVDESIAMGSRPLLRMDAFSGAVNMVTTGVCPTFDEIAAGITPPTPLCSDEVLTAIRHTTETLTEGVSRTLDGTLLFKHPDRHVWHQVSPEDSVTVWEWTQILSLSGDGEPENVIAALLPMIGPEHTADVLGVIEAEDPETPKIWKAWARDVFKTDPKAIITVVNPRGGEGQFEIEDKNLFLKVWRDVLRDAATGAFYLVTHRTPTSMREPKTGSVIHRISGFTVGVDGPTPLSAETLRLSFQTDSETGEHNLTTSDLVFRDFNIDGTPLSGNGTSQ